jgi:hypothetical protein
VVVATALLAAGCAELSPEPPRGDVHGCYSLELAGTEQERAPAPPLGIDLTDLPFVEGEVRQRTLDFHRFDALAAREAYLVYADTLHRVAWWWESEYERRLGVGNLNQAAAFYVRGVVRGDRFQGEFRRWRLDDQGRPVPGPETYTIPLVGRRAACQT